MKKVFNIVLICAAVLSLLTLASCKDVNQARPNIDFEGTLPQDGGNTVENTDDSGAENNQDIQDNTNSVNPESKPDDSVQDNKETENNENTSSVTTREDISVPDSPATGETASGSANAAVKDNNKNQDKVNQNESDKEVVIDDEEVIIDDENPKPSANGSSGGSDTNIGNGNNIWGNDNFDNSWGNNNGNGSGDSSEDDSDKYKPLPWENWGKLPDEYTLEEYEMLSDEQKQAFAEWFDSVEKFEEWWNKVHSSDSDNDIVIKNPWEELGAKQPWEYTWAEFKALSAEQQEMFFEWFGSAAEFEQWQNTAQGNTTITINPWEQFGAKQPWEYTWAEFKALSAEQQEMFFEWFGSAAEFEQWQNTAQGNTTITINPWEQFGAKQPWEYTWAEFKALSAEQQEMFFEWFGSAAEFEQWQNTAQGNTTITINPWEQFGAKQPWEYTWAEFKALSAEQQEMFFDWFASAEDFQIWMDSVTG